MPSLVAGELPAAYGTRKLLLVARDPHWLFAYWDLTDDQLKDYNRLSVDGHLVVRVYAKALEGRPVVEQAVHPESRNWFLHVPSASTRYVAELGYYDAQQAWMQISRSAATVTPAEDLSNETWVRFETLPFDIPMATLVRLVREAAAGNLPLLDAIRELQAHGHPELRIPSATPAAMGAAWSPEQEAALAKLISMDEVRRVWIGSLEITELLRRQLMSGISSGELPISSLGQAEVSPLSSLSSPFGESQPGARGFWFNVNAELIVYGATDPKATVRIGDRTIQLRPDGTFSYRFSLPDGQYALPIRATSPDGVETRCADLAFRRASEYRGEVGTHPQDERLRTPGPEHVH
ncbi:MAG: DUF4912 domain-containing protein [Verrucomicrobiales bacterium]|nr:DUF4912 domain-containing protein [Verrucomicrobiales bacterium]